jgi:chromosome segregation ATPase
MIAPSTRRRSFLLSLVNSSNRTRPRFPPSDFRSQLALFDTPGAPCDADATPGVPFNNLSLRRAFAGITPRPQMRTRANNERDFNDPAATAAFEVTPNHQAQDWTNLAIATPHDGPGSSFISTASSHDLTTHPRANTSFDPVMGFGANNRQAEVSRFNVNKLNTYLHGLNKRLQEENETLVERLRRAEIDKDTNSPAEQDHRRTSRGRVSAGGMSLENVQEDVGAEHWAEVRAELEAAAEAFKAEATQFLTERNNLETALAEERSERARDKERWKERMSEVEQGVSSIVEELEKRMHIAEDRATAAEETVKSLQIRFDEAEVIRKAMEERAQKAEDALVDGIDADAELRRSKEELRQASDELRRTAAQLKLVEENMQCSKVHAESLERDLQVKERLVQHLKVELKTKADAQELDHERIRQLEKLSEELSARLNVAEDYAQELETNGNAAVDRIEQLVHDVCELQAQIAQKDIVAEGEREKVVSLELNAQRATDEVLQLTEALNEADHQRVNQEVEIASLKAKFAALESQNSLHNGVHSLVQQMTDGGFDVETELDEAHREIARLSALLNHSPARTAIQKAKDLRIQTLEKENEELLERVRTLRDGLNTPGKVINASTASPLYRQVLSAGLRIPLTPGAPLGEVSILCTVSLSPFADVIVKMSWLQGVSQDATVSPLVNEIVRLQKELDKANESIDQKIDRLGTEGMEAVSLTQQLEDARAHIAALEQLNERHQRSAERRNKVLGTLRCNKCSTKLPIRLTEEDSIR